MHCLYLSQATAAGRSGSMSLLRIPHFPPPLPHSRRQAIIHYFTVCLSYPSSLVPGPRHPPKTRQSSPLSPPGPWGPITLRHSRSRCPRRSARSRRVSRRFGPLPHQRPRKKNPPRPPPPHCFLSPSHAPTIPIWLPMLEEVPPRTEKSLNALPRIVRLRPHLRKLCR